MNLDLLWHRVKVIALFLQYCYSVMVPEVPEVALNLIDELLVYVLLLDSILA